MIESESQNDAIIVVSQNHRIIYDELVHYAALEGVSLPGGASGAPSGAFGEPHPGARPLPAHHPLSQGPPYGSAGVNSHRPGMPPGMGAGDALKGWGHLAGGGLPKTSFFQLTYKPNL
uniref:Uncharacterized protein n=1 Tax=Anolis carolinensis TaxID=28377 RepID=A0A803TZQ5_ANOCA